MSKPISISCPKCQAKLKLKNRDAVGRKVPCPKCKQPFIVEEPAETEENFLELVDEFGDGYDTSAYDDHMDDFGEVDDGEGYGLSSPQPASRPTSRRSGRSSASGGRKRKRKKKSGGWQTPTMIAVGSVVGIAVLAGLISVAANSFSGFGTNIDVSYLPPDAELIVSVDLADAWESPFVQRLLRRPQFKPLVDSLKNQTFLQKGRQLGINDVSNVTLAMLDLSSAQNQGRPFEKQDFIMVMRFSRRFDRSEFGQMATAVDFNEESYYRGNAGNLSGMCFYVPNTKTVVMGAEEPIKQVMLRGKGSSSRPDLEFIESGQHLVVAYLPQTGKLFDEQEPFPNATAEKTGKAVRENVRAVAFGLTFTNDVQLRIQGNCNDSAAAGRLKQIFDEALAEGNVKRAENKSQIPPQFAEIAAVGETIFNSIKTEQTDATVAVTATIPATAIDSIERLPQMMMAEIMGGNDVATVDQQNPPANNINQTDSGFTNTPTSTITPPNRTETPRPGSGTPPGNANSTGSGNSSNVGRPPTITRPPNIGRRPGAPSRSFGRPRGIVVFPLEGYTGRGPARSAAFRALSRVRWADKGRIKITEKEIEIGIRTIGGAFQVNSKEARTALEAAGFKLGTGTKVLPNGR